MFPKSVKVPEWTATDRTRLPFNSHDGHFTNQREFRKTKQFQKVSKLSHDLTLFNDYDIFVFNVSGVMGSVTDDRQMTLIWWGLQKYSIPKEHWWCCHSKHEDTASLCASTLIYYERLFNVFIFICISHSFIK